MRIVYLSDWKEKQDKVKLNYFNTFGDVVFYPYLDYLNERNLISFISNDISNDIMNRNDINIIVGNGMGAYIAFYVSNHIKIPSLLLNPSFFFKNGAELKSSYNNEQFLEKNIILSSKHDSIDTKRTFKYLISLGYDNQIKIIDNLSTKIPQDFFETYFNEFYAKYKNYKLDFLKKPTKPTRRNKTSASVDDFWTATELRP